MYFFRHLPDVLQDVLRHAQGEWQARLAVLEQAGERLKGMSSRVGQASVQLGLAWRLVQRQQQQTAGSTGMEV